MAALLILRALNIICLSLQLLQLLPSINPISDCGEMASSLFLSKDEVPSLKALGSHCTFEWWIDKAACSFGAGIQVSAVLLYIVLVFRTCLP